MAQCNEVAKEEAGALKFNRHIRSSSSGTFPLRADFQRAYNSIELHDLEPLEPNRGSEDYDMLLSSLKRFFYLETKLINEKMAALQTDDNASETESSLLNQKAHVVSSYYILAAQENSLKVTTLTSLIEYTACSAVSAALGILVYIEGSKEWTTIASFILFGLCVVYKVFGYTAYVLEAWFDISEADYNRLIMEAKDKDNTENGSSTNGIANQTSPRD